MILEDLDKFCFPITARACMLVLNQLPSTAFHEMTMNFDDLLFELTHRIACLIILGLTLLQFYGLTSYTYKTIVDSIPRAVP